MRGLTIALFPDRATASIAGKVLFCAILIWPANLLVANQSRELRVSATIPPRFCQYPNECDQVGANSVTRLIVQGETIRYIGSRPLVITSFDTMTILF